MAKIKIRDEIRFVLNGDTVALGEVAPDETLLDFLRLQRSLRGSKEGCAEGDCGRLHGAGGPPARRQAGV